MGDPAGVGPELCLRVLANPGVNQICSPVVLGDQDILGRVAQACNLPEPPNVISLAEWQGEPERSGPWLIHCPSLEGAAIEPGRVDERCGLAAYTYIETAIKENLAAGRCDAVTTAPIHKEALRLAGIPHPGHTEIFAVLTEAPRSCMMLTSPDITASFVTTHVGIHEVPGLLSVERVYDVIELTHEAMGRLRGKKPRIAVCGLNPHAGEHGLFGDEEKRFIEPAIEKALARGYRVIGPLQPDAAFLKNRLRETDAFICMYHDQGHVPFKMMAFDTGVNVTLGLPIIRTSVDHGTAFDIAWQGQAQETSLVEAIKCSVAMTRAPTEGDTPG